MSSELNQKLDKFLADCQKQAYSIAFFSIKNASDSLDVIQNTMIAFVKYYQKKPEDHWRPLFYKVLQNKINDHFRSTKKWYSLFVAPKDDDLEETPYMHGENQIDSTTQYFENGEMNENMSQAIAELPERQRQAVIYRLWQGFSVKETANIMKVSQGSVKTHLSRALANLKGPLGELYE
ncbi:MAG: sigma-70 family RNA polymerase sigma factor [Marinicellaceae bacterium]